ncbi:phage tail protein [Grimontia marina]|uniref:phage tail protein n=1 Tax=Grimontia marina TaxID=646534 RepID=UPI001E34BF7C|nr:phage tail protein [Grimontia marina]
MKFARALRHYWQKVDDALRLPLTQFDALTAPIGVVKLMAWERDITPLEREDEMIFRIRVANAYPFARHAGETRGFRTMFAKLGVDWVDIHEREDPVQWDVVTIDTADGELAQKGWLMNAMIRQYGRTCRRYQFNVTYPVALRVHGGAFGHRFDLASAHATDSVSINLPPQPAETRQQLFIATLSQPEGGET